MRLNRLSRVGGAAVGLLACVLSVACQDAETREWLHHVEVTRQFFAAASRGDSVALQRLAADQRALEIAARVSRALPALVEGAADEARLGRGWRMNDSVDIVEVWVDEGGQRVDLTVEFRWRGGNELLIWHVAFPEGLEAP